MIETTGTPRESFLEAERALRDQLLAGLDFAKATFPAAEEIEFSLLGDRLVMLRTRGKPYLFTVPYGEKAEPLASLYYFAKVDGEWKVIPGTRRLAMSYPAGP